MTEPLTPEAATTLAHIVASIISQDMNMNQRNAVGNWLELVGQVIETASAQEQLIQGNQPQQQNANLSQRLTTLEESIQALHQEVRRLTDLISDQLL